MHLFNNEVTKIGVGEFSRAYRVINSDVVYILSKTESECNQYVKEIYTHIEGKHIPYMSTIELAIYHSGLGWVNAYESRFYAPLTAKNTEAWRIYRILEKTWAMVKDNNRSKIDKSMNGEYYERHAVCREFIDYLIESNGIVPESIIDALKLIYSWATCYGSGFLFEFNKANLRVDNNGDLVLLDVIFFRTVAEDRKRQQKMQAKMQRYYDR